MTLGDYVSNAHARFEREDLMTGFYGGVQELWEGALGVVGENIYNYGTPVWEREWDVLLVLDTCRPDVLDEVADGYSFLNGYDPAIDSINSVGSRSPEWIRKTFDPASFGSELAETAYVSANPHTRDIPQPEQLGLLDEVWKYAWDDDWGNVPPENTTDRAVAVGRDHDFDRLIVHYMQPHAPYRKIVQENPEWFSLSVGMDNPEDRPDINLWERYRVGRVSREELWPAYRDTLKWVLDSVEVLLGNLNADTVVISSDHGEAFGEWWYYGHSTPAPIPPLKRVPWATTTATDRRSYTPDIEPPKEYLHMSEADVTDRLEALGYR